MKATPWLLGAVLLGTFGYFHREGGFNQNVRFDLTRAVVERRTLTIDAYHENTLDKAFRNGHYYCDKPPGVSFLGVPAYWLAYRSARWLGGDPLERAALTRGFYAARMTAVSVAGVLLAVALLRAIGPWCRSAWAVTIAVGLGLGTLVFPYSTLLYGHTVAAALLFLSFLVLFEDRRREPAATWKIGLAGAAAAAAVVADYPAALGVGLLGAYLLFGPRPWNRLLWFAAGASVPTAGLMVYHALCFGSPFSTGFQYEAMKHWQAKYGTGFYGLRLPTGEALYQLTFGPRRGLFYQAPWLLLALPGLWGLAVRRWWSEAALVFCMFLSTLLFSASLHSWEGGWTMGARYLIPALPFLAFAAAFARGSAAGAVAALLVPPSVFFMLAGSAVMPQVPLFVPDPLADLLVPYVLSGRISIPDPGGRAFNLGQALGLAGSWSLIPLLALWCGGALGLWRTLRSERGGARDQRTVL